MAHPLSAYDNFAISDNIVRAERWFSLLLNHISHIDFAADWILWAKFLDDTVEVNRTRGILFDGEMIKRLDGIILVGDRLSFGMKAEMEAAQVAGKRVINLIGAPFVSSHIAELLRDA